MPRVQHHAPAVLLAGALLWVQLGATPTAAYQDGDFVAIARRGQFHEVSSALLESSYA